MIFAIVCLVILNDPPSLPAEWHGSYSGSMVINALADPKKTIPVTLEIAPEKEGGAVSWKMTFINGEKKTVKDYRLVPTTKAGEFKIDEKNGIELPTRIAGNVMVSTFEVGGTLLVARYELKGKTLTYEIQGYGKPGESGQGVKTFPLRSLQTVEFKKP